MARNLRYDDKGNLLLKGEIQKKDGSYSFSFINPVTKKNNFLFSDTLKGLRKKENEMHSFTLRESFMYKREEATLNDYFKVYQEITIVSPAVEFNYQRMWDSQVRYTIGNMKVVDVTEGVIHLLFAELSKNGYKRNTIKYIKTLLTNALEIAFVEGVIRFNPVRKLRISKYGLDRYEADPLNQVQEKKLLEFIKNSKRYSKYQFAILIRLLTGLRPGEMTCLTWSDVDLKDNKLHITKQFIYKNYGDGCKFHLRDTKTKDGKRVLPMFPALKKAFAEHKAMQEASGIKSVEVEGITDFVFITKNGRPVMPAGFNTCMKRIREAYNEYEKKNGGSDFIKDLSSYTFRYTACTRMAELKVAPKVMQMYLGHADTRITMEAYNKAKSYMHLKSEIPPLDDHYSVFY
ncbi:MAG: tyrosine-type recombinase/integrase [Clostridiales bacterium]|nr:tyrosine-type recombinase/integrase [Clostridiales bacterium]MBS5877823.1 tyrosine-type recombinase/integrase [Clostridiales bacterium]